jgi:mannose-6-phosphate isomerase-like protein (cupin superfamily)
MKVINIGDLPKVVLPQHYGHSARELRGPDSGNPDLSVLFCQMDANGRAETHTHSEAEHIFVIVEGELQSHDGKEKCVVSKGQAMVIERGELHEITGTRRGADCTYVVITIPPVWTK